MNRRGVLLAAAAMAAGWRAGAQEAPKSDHIGVLRRIIDNRIIAIMALYIFADIGTLSGCGIVIVGVGDA
jgi:hypothetical protein